MTHRGIEVANSDVSDGESVYCAFIVPAGEFARDFRVLHSLRPVSKRCVRTRSEKPYAVSKSSCITVERRPNANDVIQLLQGPGVSSQVCIGLSPQQRRIIKPRIFAENPITIRGRQLIFSFTC